MVNGRAGVIVIILQNIGRSFASSFENQRFWVFPFGICRLFERKSKNFWLR